MSRTLLTGALLLAGTPLAAQTAPTPPGWYSGDTHDHYQLCCEDPGFCLKNYGKTVFDASDVLASMEADDLDVASVLVWEPGFTNPDEPYTKFVCDVTGVPDPASTATRLIQLGVEVSGLGASRWGHLIGLNLDFDQALLATMPPGPGFCVAPEPLELPCPGPDGTGQYLGPLCDRFADCDTVRGYAHQAWPEGIFDPQGQPATYIDPSEYVCIDSDDSLAFPDMNCLVGCEIKTQILPLFAAIHVALGKVEFLESDHLSLDFAYRPPQSCGGTPCQTTPLPWYGAYYKLLSAGLRVGVSAGSDRSCGPANGGLGPPRTWVYCPQGLSYEGWARGIAEGRTTLSMGRSRFLDLRVEGQGIGSTVEVSGPQPKVDVVARFSTTEQTTDVIEVLFNGEVAAQQPFSSPPGGGTFQLSLNNAQVPESGWVVARLASQNAHTAATYVIVDDQPIADCESAEYWMAWCDLLTLSIGDDPGLFGCQDEVAQVLSDVGAAREVFRALRDVALPDAFRPDARRFGHSVPGSRGPLSIGVSEGSGDDGLTLTCTNAPRGGEGFLWLTAPPAADGGTPAERTRTGNALGRLSREGELLGLQPVRADRSGFARVRLELSRVPSGTPVGARFVWLRPDPCATPSRAFSASDAVLLSAP